MSAYPEIALLFGRLAERHPDGILVLERSPDDELAVAYASPAVRWLGASTLSELLDSDAFARWRCAYDDACSLERGLELVLPLPDRTEQRATVVALDASHVAVQLRLSDRALLVAAEEARQHEGRFELLFSQNIHGVFFMRLDEPFHWASTTEEQDAQLAYALEHLRVTAVNDAMCRQMESRREQLVGTTSKARWSDRPIQWREQMRRLYTQGHTYHCQKVPRGDGSTWFDVEGEYVCTYDSLGRITGHLGIQRDISYRRTAETELANSRERLDLAIVGADLGIWELNVRAQQVYVDPAWLAKFGYSAAAWRSYDWLRSVVHPDEYEEARRGLTAHLAGVEPLFRVEFRMQTASGEWIWVQLTGKKTQNEPHRIVGVSVDITERKALQERLVASERLAALGTLAAGVGHEINNPLTFVTLTLALMERTLVTLPGDGPTKEAFSTLIQRARYGADRVSAVVRDLQMVARPQGTAVIAANPVPIVERCLQIADHQIRQRARVICDFDTTPNVRCSEDRLVQVFLILIINAAQAIPEGSADRHWIRIATATAPDGRVLIEVSDNGAGIAAEDLGRVFEPFYTTKRGTEGTGLGLSICRGIVATLGGEIEVESQLGRGTAFRVLLPAASPGEPIMPTPAATAATVRRVLVIDDEPMLGVLVKSVLDDVDVTTETCARAALARLESGEAFDRILCDMMMPELSGIDFYDQVSEQQRPHIVFITGASFSERTRDFLARVPNRLLLKPFDPASLISALAE